MCFLKNCYARACMCIHPLPFNHHVTHKREFDLNKVRLTMKPVNAKNVQKIDLNCIKIYIRFN